MKPQIPVGIIGYGAYVPMWRMKSTEVARIWCRDGNHCPVEEFTVPGIDEDAVTIAVEASKLALKRSGLDTGEIGAVHFGSESKPYAVKSCSAIIAAALGISPYITAGDYEFACKAGTEALQTCMGLVGSGMIKAGLAVGVDTAQSAPSDELEYTGGAGGAAFILAPNSESCIARIDASLSYVTETPDFWRRALQPYPSHAQRFTGEPAYFRHVMEAAKALMAEVKCTPEDYSYVVLHQPNSKFPAKAALTLGFAMKQLEPGLLSPQIGNTYAGSSVLGLAAVLDVAKPDERILLVSYGSGSGSDAFSIVVEQGIITNHCEPLLSQIVQRKKYIDYAQYARLREKYVM